MPWHRNILNACMDYRRAPVDDVTSMFAERLSLLVIVTPNILTPPNDWTYSCGSLYTDPHDPTVPRHAFCEHYSNRLCAV